MIDDDSHAPLSSVKSQSTRKEKKNIKKIPKREGVVAVAAAFEENPKKKKEDL